MKSSKRREYRGESWKALSKVIDRGRSRDRVFTDWLDLMLTAYLSATDNLRQLETDPNKWDGVYERRYLEIVEHYKTNEPLGERPIDHLAAAFGHLIGEIEQKGGADCLGEMYEAEITFGEHGQYFTPEPVAQMMASIIETPSLSEPGRKIVCDPACGSGRMLFAMHKVDPNAFYVGVDLDPRCAKMCALNLYLRGIEGDVYNGDSLAGQMYTCWMVRRLGPLPLLIEDAKPETPPRLQKLAKDAQQLTLL